MADLPSAIAKAKKSGYSDAEITAYIASDPNLAPKVKSARAAGYSDAEIIGHLGKVNPAADFGKSLATGVGQAVSGIVGLRGDMQDLQGNLAEKGFTALGRKLNLFTPEQIAAQDRGPKWSNEFSRSNGAVTSSEVNKLVGLTYEPQTTAGKYARTTGNMATNALIPGGLLRKGLAVVAPGLASEGAGEAVEAMGGGQVASTVARVAGGMVGGAVVAARAPRVAPASAEAQTASTIAKRAKPQVAEMRAKTDAMRSAGVEPSLIDVGGDRARRLVRAVGVKSPEAGETLAANARAVSSSAKPAIMARTQKVGPHQGKTADQLVEDLFKARDDGATTNYAAAYGTPVKVDESVLKALSDEPGRAALRRARAAAVARMDEGRVKEIDSLLGAKPPESVTAATVHRSRIAMRERAQTAQQRNAGDMASGLNMRGQMLDDALENVPEMAPANADYRAKSQALNVLGEGKKGGRQDLYSTDPGDYGRWLEALSPEAKQANQVAIRQEVLDTLGGQRSSTFGSVDELATSEYAKANLKQALGDDAGPYLAFLESKLEQVRNARMVDPNAGSRTAVLENDLSGVVKAGAIGAQAMSGNTGGALAATGLWLMRRGVSEEQARLIASASTDPAQLDSVLAFLEQRLGQPAAQEYLAHIRNPALLGAAAGLGATRQPSDEPPQEQSPRR